VFGPRIAGAVSGGRDAARRPYAGLIVAGFSGVAAAIVLYGGIELMGAAGQIVPATPLVALPFACLTGAFGAILGHTVATRVRAWVDLRAVAKVAAPLVSSAQAT